VVVIPGGIADEVADEAFEQTAFEDFVSEMIHSGKSIFGIYPPNDDARAEFARWRAAKGR
jgi:regulator of RNase E activity RraA